MIFEATITSQMPRAAYTVSESGHVLHNVEVSKRFARQVKQVILETLVPTSLLIERIRFYSYTAYWFALPVLVGTMYGHHAYREAVRCSGHTFEGLVRSSFLISRLESVGSVRSGWARSTCTL